MKRILILFLLIGALSFSQETRFEKIKALKTAYLTEKLNLTSAQAEKFWPVYNEYDAKFDQLRHKRYQDFHGVLKSNQQNLTDEQANKLINDYLDLESQQLELQKKKIVALRSVIPPTKIIMLRKAEDDFKHELLDRYRKRKQKGSPSDK